MKTILFILFLIISTISNSQYAIYVAPNSNEIITTIGQNLNFGILNKGSIDSTTILISDSRTAWIKVTAPKNKTIGITISTPYYLNLNSFTIPVQIIASYSNSANNNSGNIQTIKNASTQIPIGINYVEIPVSLNPNQGGNNKIFSDIYLFFYGTIAPIPINIQSGIYDGIIFLDFILVE